MKCLLKLYLLEPALLIASFLLMLILTGSCRNQTVPVRIVEQKSTLHQPYSRIDIPQEELAEGLSRVFEQISKRLGPVDYEPIIKDYLPLIRQGLYHRGYCRIMKLNINNTTVDMDIYFRLDEFSSSLNIDVYLNGQISPDISMSNQYYVTGE